jgi:DNA-binding Xre family transcriptional regulator
MLTMTVTASLASQGVSENHGVKRAPASAESPTLSRTFRGSVFSDRQESIPGESARPVSARRAALMSTDAGRAMAQDARKDIAAALDAHGISKVAALRLAAGLSQKELSAKTNILQPHISRLENGKVKTPELPTLMAISGALNVSLETLVMAFIADTAEA